jgi:prefoldin subunit 5
MIDDTLKQIETQLNSAESISESRRRELLQLLAKLKSEVAGLSETHGEEAQSIAGFTQVSAHEATRETPRPDLLELSLQGLRSSVEGFEKTHPKLVHVVNSISNTLSNLGI